MSLHRIGETLFWDHASRDHLHVGSKLAGAIVLKDHVMLSNEIPDYAEKWWNKCVAFLREQKQMYHEVDVSTEVVG